MATRLATRRQGHDFSWTGEIARRLFGRAIVSNPRPPPRLRAYCAESP
jgi:hypothetical protein